MATVTMTLEEYEALIRQLQVMTPENIERVITEAPKKKTRSTAYSRKYKAAFRKIAPKYKLKSGKWKKNGFKTAVKLAHKEARK